jgi:hypothetical protein
MDALESERPPASIVGPANGIPLEHLVAQSYRDHPPTPMERPSVVEPVAEPRKPEPRALIPAEPGLSLDALIMRDRAAPPPARVEPSRQAFDDWAAQNMLWPEPKR